MSFSVEKSVGRLVEARVYRLPGVADVERYGQAFAPYLHARPRPVLVADHRPAAVYAPGVAERLVTMFEGLNRTWTRAALLVDRSNATLIIQLQRIVRESKNDSRRVFMDEAACEAFLVPELDAEERRRLHAFLTQSAQPR